MSRWVLQVESQLTALLKAPTVYLAGNGSHEDGLQGSEVSYWPEETRFKDSDVMEESKVLDN